MRRALLAAMAALTISITVYGQDEEKHPIDKALESCLDKNSSTAGMVECMDRAYKQWDGELNRVYAELMKRLDAAEKAKLKEAQLQWLKFRDSEFKVIDGIYSKMDGTMYIPMHVDSRALIVRNRALELKSYLSLLE
jgi:uncharacterized protein YecT (DUF1311 family)